jgi:hypothetical protein
MKTKEIILSDQGGNYIVPAKGEDAIPVVPIPALTLTNTEYNVLAVALDHMYEHLNDLEGDLDNSEEEKINLSRIDDVLSLKEMFNL